MITCHKCGKDNQDHYKFCLGCGAELDKPAPPPLVGAPAAPHPVGGLPPDSSEDGAQSGGGEPVNCPQCHHANSPANRFCAACGYKLNLASIPKREADRAVAGGRVVGRVVLTALRADGSEAGSYEVPAGASTTIGRDTGSIFAGDSYLSPSHATFVRRAGQILVSDAGSLNGIYLRIPQQTPWALKFGDVFRIGQEILRLEKLEKQKPSADGVQRLGSPAGTWVARLGLVIGRDTTGNAFLVPRSGLHLGRERGDVLFPEDGYVSGLHCKLTVGGDESLSLTDLGSSNGSFVRLREEHPVTGGDVLLMGQQLFRVDL